MVVFFNNRIPGVQLRTTIVNIIESIFTFILIVFIIRAVDGVLVVEYNSIISWLLYSIRTAIISFLVAMIVLIIFQRNTVISLFKRFI